MRYDIFLSSVLFGITLLTCALAIMHLACDGFLRSRNFPPPVRRKIRTLLLGSTISVSLLVFLVRLCSDLSGHALFDWGLGADGGFFPRRVARVEATVAVDEPMKREFRPDESWTLFEKSTRELKSQKLQASNLVLSSAKAYVWTAEKPGSVCNSWIDRVKALGIDPRATKSPQSLPEGSFLIACASGKPDAKAWDQLKAHVFKGGSLLVAGAVPGAAADAVQAMTRIAAFRALDEKSKEPIKVVTGSSKLAWGGFPSGLRMYFGGNAQTRSEMGLAEVGSTDADSALLREETSDSLHAGSGPVLSGLISSSYGKGRVAWIGVPARIDRKSELLNGDAWELLSQRLVAHLLQLPQAGLKLWPDGNAAPVIVAIQSEVDLGEDVSVSKLLRQKKVPSSHFAIMSEALAHPRDFSRVIASQDEVGISELDHGPVAALDFYERYSRIRRWQQLYVDLPRGESQATLPYGAMTTPGVNSVADQFAALMANRVRYALMDPFGDKLSPYQAHLSKTAPLMKSISEGQELSDAPSASSMIVWPNRSLDDRAMLREAGGAAEKSELRRILVDQYQQSRWAGGPYLFRISTGGLARDSSSSTLSYLIDALNQQGASFMSAEELIRFWETRSDTEVAIEPIERSRMPDELDAEADKSESAHSDDAEEMDLYPDGGAAQPRSGKKLYFKVTVTNGSASPLEKSVLRITESQRFKALVRKTAGAAPAVTSDPQTHAIQVALPKLQPGESYTLWLAERDEEVAQFRGKIPPTLQIAKR